jgi:hypothetical protein
MQERGTPECDIIEPGVSRLRPLIGRRYSPG